jgi:hypothetical protein
VGRLAAAAPTPREEPESGDPSASGEDLGAILVREEFALQFHCQHLAAWMTQGACRPCQLDRLESLTALVRTS